jgi:hypothetical protein
MAFPATFNIQYYRGDTYEFIIYAKRSDGSSYDLTSFTGQPFFNIATARATATTPAPIVATGTASISDNAVTCTLPPAQGLLLNPGTTYYYDVQVSNNNVTPNVVYTLLTGTVTVTGDVTP